ncbi:MAG: hypothetical protein G8345_04770 [Magnetococcales bacterium]|nr:hypothetical protein [Magnetococcales bacterium]NGZ26183.1 hypothetical protein [Magnetococcales bacterium]
MKNIKYTMVIVSLLAVNQVMAAEPKMSQEESMIGLFKGLCTPEKQNFDNLNKKASLAGLKVTSELDQPIKDGYYIRSKSWNVPEKTTNFEVSATESNDARGLLQICSVSSHDIDGEKFKNEIRKAFKLTMKPVEEKSLSGKTRKTIWFDLYGKGTVLVLDDTTPQAQLGVKLTIMDGNLKSTQGEDGCSYRKIDALPSPMINWSIERTRVSCSNDTEGSQIFFSMLRPGEAFKKEKVFFKTNNSEVKWGALSVFAKWMDDQHLLIAAPEGANLQTMPSEVNNVSIQYVYYPLDSDKSKDWELKKQIDRKVQLKTVFKQDKGFGARGVGCNLIVSAYDRQNLDKLELFLTARMTYATRAYDQKLEKSVLNEAYSSYSYQVIGWDRLPRPEKRVTGAEVLGFSPQDGKSTLWTYYYNEPLEKSISGTLPPKWGFGYRPDDPQDILSMARQVKSGTAAIRLNYWLDSEIFLYTGEPEDQIPIDMFEKCINDNTIFDFPRHVNDR